MRNLLLILILPTFHFIVSSLHPTTPLKVVLVSADAAHRADNLPEGWSVIPMRSNKEISLYLRSVNKNAKIVVAIHGNEKGLRVKGDERWHWDSYMDLVEGLNLNLYQVSCLGSKEEGDWNGYIREERGVKFLTKLGYKLRYDLEALDKLP